ncbi:small ribosomal subunit protein mS25 [Planococcus citri]|uniref:small ribosomal subunit protein mS25 n=1 Tax=Planococcus citri TaxID=170843 RepID=UPI0031F89982
MPFKVGANAIIRTQHYLDAGKIYLNDKIKVFCVHVNSWGDRHKGLNDFLTWHMPQIQYKNPNVHCIVLKNMTPTPFIRCFLDNGEHVIVDTDNKEKREILNHVITVLGKAEHVLQSELLAQEKKENPANFGYLCSKHCICQIIGQVPCPAIVPVPQKWRGKWKTQNKDA